MLCLFIALSVVVQVAWGDASLSSEKMPMPPRGFVFMPPGSFVMGSPAGERGRDGDEVWHVVHITEGFLMQTTEVTQEQYEAVMETNPSHFRGPRLPVEKVSWDDAVEFCNRMSLRDGLTPCYAVVGNETVWDPRADGYRLPTEAEWEYACRAGVTTEYGIGIGEGALELAGWYRGNSRQRTHEVGQKRANAWGLFDMHGNVWEWCWDWYGSYRPEAQADPSGPPFGRVRVLRGGGWDAPPSDCRSARRLRYVPRLRNYNVGIRLVRNQKTTHAP